MDIDCLRQVVGRDVGRLLPEQPPDQLIDTDAVVGEPVGPLQVIQSVGKSPLVVSVADPVEGHLAGPRLFWWQFPDRHPLAESVDCVVLGVHLPSTRS